MFETKTKKLKRSKLRNNKKEKDVSSSSKKKKASVEDAYINKDFGKKKVGTRRLRMVSEKEQKNDKAIENESNLSVTMMIVILVVCFCVGIALGYIMYRLAIDTSAMVATVRNNLFNIICLENII